MRPSTGALTMAYMACMGHPGVNPRGLMIFGCRGLLLVCVQRAKPIMVLRLRASHDYGLHRAPHSRRRRRARGGARVGSSVLPTMEKSPSWPGNSSETDWISELTWVQVYVFYYGLHRAPHSRRRRRARGGARAWEVLYCPQWKSRHVGLETKVNP